MGEGRERIYLVEQTGPIEDDPNLTDKKFPGNPTRSYRSKHAFKVVGEITIWQAHPPEQVKAMKEGLAKLKDEGIEAIEGNLISGTSKLVPFRIYFSSLMKKSNKRNQGDLPT